MIRTRLAGISNVSQTPARASNGTWVLDQMVTLLPSHWATTARGSMGAAWQPSAT